MTTTAKIVRSLTVAIVAVIALASPAQADILLEFDRLISGVEGSIRTVGDVDVDDDLVGQTCQVSVIGENQASVHPGNDLIVSTGGSQAVVVGVEDEVNAGINQTYQLVMGESIVVQLRFGPDELSSLGFAISFDCDQSLITTTTTAPVTTTTQVPTTVAVTCADGSSAAITNGDTSNTTDSSDAATGSTDGCEPVACNDGSSAAVTNGSSTSGSSTDASALTESDSCAPANCTDGSSIAVTNGSSTAGSSTAGSGTDASALTEADSCTPASCDDASTDANATTSDDAGSDPTTVASALVEGDTDCSEPPASQTPGSTTSTTVAPPVTAVASPASTTTVAPAGSATASLPQSPVATAIAAAPAYAG